MDRLAKASNPVKKAKLEVRLGELKMSLAFGAYDQGKFDSCWKYLNEYLARMDSAWTTLQASGREASKKPDGFKQLDIALRTSRRSLEDFETRVTFEEREEVERVRKETEALRAHVLEVMFPPTKHKKPKKENHFATQLRIARVSQGVAE
jgi:hypothetical protein